MCTTYIQIVSDLHLETHPSYTDYDLPVTAAQLALLGDIGRICDPGLFAFLEAQLLRYSTVYFLLGNHEPYHMTWRRAKTTMTDFAAKAARRYAKGLAGQFVFLDQTRFDVSDSITVLGCTLFSCVLPQQEWAVESRVVDFKEIARWTVDDHNAEHERDLSWLNAQIHEIARNEPGRKIIIFTHYSPSRDERAIRPVHRNSDVATGFSTDLEDQPCWTSSSVAAWSFGHTHYCCDFKDRYGKRVLSNQKGYYMFPQQAFDAAKILKIELQ